MQDDIKEDLMDKDILYTQLQTEQQIKGLLEDDGQDTKEQQPALTVFQQKILKSIKTKDFDCMSSQSDDEGIHIPTSLDDSKRGRLQIFQQITFKENDHKDRTQVKKAKQVIAQ